MKIGIRKPSIKKSVKARTTGKIEKSIKKTINPLYGNKGMGFAKNPVNSINNSIYHKTTIGVSDILKSSLNSSSNNRNNNAADNNSNSFKDTKKNKSSISKNNKLKIILVVLIFLLFLFTRAIFIELNKAPNNNTDNHQNIKTSSENIITESIQETDTQIQTNSIEINENEKSFNSTEQPVENTIVEEVPIVTSTIPNNTQTSILEQPETEPVIEQNKNKITETYILNTNTKKFHKSYCSSVKQIKSSNYSEFTGTRDEIINKGYSPCGKCKP